MPCTEPNDLMSIHGLVAGKLFFLCVCMMWIVEIFLPEFSLIFIFRDAFYVMRSI